jgi:hypothetical protein
MSHPEHLQDGGGGDDDMKTMITVITEIITINFVF